MTKQEAIKTLFESQEQLVAIRDNGSVPDSCLASCVLALSELARENNLEGWAVMHYTHAKQEIGE